MNRPKTTARTGTKRRKTRANDHPMSPNGACCEHIRERAYYKWEAAGCPSDDGIEFWLQAEAEVANETRSVAEASTT